MVLNRTSLDWFVHEGVSQGFILGPLLFYNDLPNVAQHCSINLCADDTAFYFSSDNPGIISDVLEP